MTTSSWDETTKAERRTWTVIALCAVMMVADTVGGTLFRIVGPDRGRTADVDACRRPAARRGGLHVRAQILRRSELHLRYRKVRRRGQIEHRHHPRTGTATAVFATIFLVMTSQGLQARTQRHTRHPLAGRQGRRRRPSPGKGLRTSIPRPRTRCYRAMGRISNSASTMGQSGTLSRVH